MPAHPNPRVFGKSPSPPSRRLQELFCDTDSMAIVAMKTGGLVPCGGGPHRVPDGTSAIRALSWAQVDTIVTRFAALNPYDRTVVPGSILKIEDENFDETSRERRQLCCYAISAKRYALFTVAPDGRPVIRKYSEHGLGHLLDPLDPDDDSGDWIRALTSRVGSRRRRRVGRTRIR